MNRVSEDLDLKHSFQWKPIVEELPKYGKTESIFVKIFATFHRDNHLSIYMKWIWDWSLKFYHIQTRTSVSISVCVCVCVCVCVF